MDQRWLCRVHGPELLLRLRRQQPDRVHGRLLGHQLRQGLSIPGRHHEHDHQHDHDHDHDVYHDDHHDDHHDALHLAHDDHVSVSHHLSDDACDHDHHVGLALHHDHDH
jgi:hypothetical protein